MAERAPKELRTSGREVWNAVVKHLDLDRHEVQWSNKSSVRFTVNEVVVGRDVGTNAYAAHSWMGARPRSGTSGYAVNDSELPGHWHERIGLLMPRHDDYWWDVGRSTDAKKLATEIVSAIDTHVLPAMREHMT